MDLLIARALGLLVIALVVAILARRLKLPYTVGLVLAGVVLAFSRLNFGVSLTHDIIFDVILPPLLFEAALNLRGSELRRDMLPVAALSIGGVVVSAALVAAGMVWLLAWPLMSALIFGVLIAATDPVAVIAMFKDIGLRGRLRLLVESESLFNDGVAAVLFSLVLDWSQGRAAGAVEATQSLVAISGGGVLVGLAIAAIATLIARGASESIVEAAVTAVAAYGSFLAAEYFGFSGVLATVSAGLLMGNLGVRDGETGWGLSPKGRKLALELWDFAAFLANSVVFLLIGITVAGIPFAAVGYLPLFIAILLVLSGRAVTVYPALWLFAGSRWTFSASQAAVLWWGGLRGALALALSLSLPADLPLRNAVVIVTFAVVAFSVIVQGLSMPLLLRFLKLLPDRAEG